MMRRISFNVFSLFILSLVLFINVSSAQKFKPDQGTSANKEILLIPSLAKQGYLSFYFDKEGFFIQVEPLFWQKALHRDKVELVKAAMQTARFMNKEKNMNLRTVMFTNMTTHEELAFGSISGLNPGKYEILK